MKKLIYGALLLLAVPAFQSCIDDGESMSVTKVREAKANELNALADLLTAKAQAEASAATASAALQASQAKINEAQAALLQAQVEYQNIQNQLANVKLDEEKVALQLKQAELDYKIQYYNQMIDQSKKEMEKAEKELELALLNIENQLLQAQITNLQWQAKYQEQLIKNEAMDSTWAAYKINVLLNQLNAATSVLTTAQGAYTTAKNNLASAQSALYNAQQATEDAYNANVDQINIYEGALAYAQAQLAVVKQFDENPSLEEITDSLNKSTLLELQKATELSLAQNNLTAATNAVTLATTNLDNTVYEQDGVEPFKGKFGSTVTDYPVNKKDTAYTYWVNTYKGEDGHNIVDTLFTTITVSNYAVSADSASMGLVSGSQLYTTYLAYWTPDTASLKTFIAQQAAANMNESLSVEYLQNKYDQAVVHEDSMKNVLAIAQQSLEAHEAELAPLQAQYDYLDSIIGAVDFVNNPEHKAIQEAYNLAAATLAKAEQDTSKYSDLVKNYQLVYDNDTADLTSLKRQLAEATDINDSTRLEAEIADKEKAISASLFKLNTAKQNETLAMNQLKSAQDQYDYAYEAYSKLLEASENQDAATEMLNEFLDPDSMYQFLLSQVSTAQGHVSAYEQLYEDAIEATDAALLALNKALAGDNVVDTELEDALQVLLDEADNLAKYVLAYNEAVKAEAEAQIVVNEAKTAYMAVKGTVDALNAYLTGLPYGSMLWNPETGELVYDDADFDLDDLENQPQYPGVAYLEGLIAALQNAISGLEAENEELLNTEYPTQEEAIADAQAALDRAQVILDAAQAQYDIYEKALQDAMNAAE